MENKKKIGRCCHHPISDRVELTETTVNINHKTGLVTSMAGFYCNDHRSFGWWSFQTPIAGWSPKQLPGWAVR